MGIGDWDWGLGIGIGDWAQSPIPNPQSPIEEEILIIYILVSFMKSLHFVSLFLITNTAKVSYNLKKFSSFSSKH